MDRTGMYAGGMSQFTNCPWMGPCSYGMQQLQLLVRKGNNMLEKGQG